MSRMKKLLKPHVLKNTNFLFSLCFGCKNLTRSIHLTGAGCDLTCVFIIIISKQRNYDEFFKFFKVFFAQSKNYSVKESKKNHLKTKIVYNFYLSAVRKKIIFSKNKNIHIEATTKKVQQKQKRNERNV